MGIMSSIKKTLGIDDDYEYEEVYEERDLEEANEIVEKNIDKENIIRGPFQRGREEVRDARELIKKPKAEIKQEVHIVSPKSFDEALKVSEAFLSGKIVILNTSYMELRVAQRFLDFVSGTSFAVKGDINRVEENIYIVTPASINVDSQSEKDSTFRNLFGL